MLIPVEEFSKSTPIYFSCKAINYRFHMNTKNKKKKNKWDGNRPLSVFVDWDLEEGKLIGKIIFENPLVTHANLIGMKIRMLLEKLNIQNENFEKLKDHLHKEINYYI